MPLTFQEIKKAFADPKSLAWELNVDNNYTFLTIAICFRNNPSLFLQTIQQQLLNDSVWKTYLYTLFYATVILENMLDTFVEHLNRLA